jgi:hypothetical protein
MFVIYNIYEILSYVCVLCLDTKFHMSSSSASLVIVIKSKNIYKFHVAIIKLFHICICFRRFQGFALNGGSITIIKDFCLPTLFVY